MLSCLVLADLLSSLVCDVFLCFVTFYKAFQVRCGTSLHRFLIFAFFSVLLQSVDFACPSEMTQQITGTIDL